jgi:hypothetical protein
VVTVVFRRILGLASASTDTSAGFFLLTVLVVLGGSVAEGKRIVAVVFLGLV